MRLRGSRARERRTVRERARELNKISTKLESEVLSEVMGREALFQWEKRYFTFVIVLKVENYPSKTPISSNYFKMLVFFGPKLVKITKGLW